MTMPSGMSVGMIPQQQAQVMQNPMMPTMMTGMHSGMMPQVMVAGMQNGMVPTMMSTMQQQQQQQQQQAGLSGLATSQSTVAHSADAANNLTQAVVAMTTEHVDVDSTNQTI
jgi:hypothetical protein